MGKIPGGDICFTTARQSEAKQVFDFFSFQTNLIFPKTLFPHLLEHYATFSDYQAFLFEHAEHRFI